MSFLKAYRGAKQSFQTELGIFNGVSDFNTFAGRGDEFRAGATRLRTAATVLQNVTTPPAMVDLSKNIRASLSEAADEFDDVGHGFDVAVDDLIYGPVHKIEATTATFESQERKWYTSALENSRILRDTRDLLEKIDPVSDVPR